MTLDIILLMAVATLLASIYIILRHDEIVDRERLRRDSAERFDAAKSAKGQDR